MDANWYAVYTKPQQELKTSAALIKKGFECLCPLTRKMLVNTTFGKKITWQPVFNSFVFVRITEADFSKVLRSGDVINFMYWMGRPAVIASEDIANIEKFVSRYPNVTVEKTAIVRNMLAIAGDDTTGDEENIQVKLPSIGFILTASREKNYRIAGSTTRFGRAV